MLAAILIVLPSIASAVEQQAIDQATGQLISEHPGVQLYLENGYLTKLYGMPMGYGSSAIDAATAFRNGYAEVFGSESIDLVAGSPRDMSLIEQPVYYLPESDSYKFTLIYFTQQRDGIPVFGSELRVLVKNEPGYPVVQVTSTLKNLGEFRPTDKATADFGASQIMIQAIYPELTSYSDMKQVIYVDESGAEPGYHVGFEFEATDNAHAHRHFVTDAVSGTILHDEDRVVFEDILGSVEGLATQGFSAEQCASEVATPMPYAKVTGGSSTAYADENGEFVLSIPGSQTIVASFLEGTWFNVDNVAGEDAILSSQTVAPGPADFLHNPTNTESVRSQVNGYLHANAVRDMTLTYNPAYPTVHGQTNFPVYVNRTDGYCPGNAWYNGFSINFCQSSGSLPNTAFSTVVYHEYGHHLVQMAGSGQDQYGEGMSDCVAIMISDNSGLAYGFFGSCGSPLRSADNSLQYPCSGGSHSCGRLLSGCVWDLRENLIATNPSTYRDILGALTINSILLHSGSQITPQITIDFLTLDDDDGNIFNGTPHWDEICEAFGDHSMTCPVQLPLAFEYPTGRPNEAAPLQATDIDVNVNAVGAAPIEGTFDAYAAIDDNPYAPIPIVENGTNSFTISLPAADCGSQLNWYVQMEAQGGGIVTDPPGAPEAYFGAVVATEALEVFVDDFEEYLGWFETGDATGGNWEKGVPGAGGVNGDPTSDFDGSGSCYVTQNQAGDSDVDDGTTRLTSLRLDLTGTNSLVSYATWFSNSTGDNPFEDVMVVLLSNDNGISWDTVEVIGPTERAEGGWYVNQFWVNDILEPNALMRLRFEVSDLGDPSTVEAAVDAVSIIDYECISFICGDADGSSEIDIDDVVYAIDYIFGGGPAPIPLDAADVDCSGNVDIDDVVYLIAYIFTAGPIPCNGC